MEADARYNRLMHEVCVGMGWCGSTIDGKPAHVDDYIPESGLVTADQFAVWVIQADGENPERHSRSRKLLVEAFVRHMGADRVDAAELQWKF